MESVQKAKQRFRQYPVVLAKCGKEATEYAVCVLKRDNVGLDDCKDEFGRFKNCLRKSAAELKTRLVHLVVGLVVRLMLVAYGVYHDRVSAVPYTDVDYRVFTDAARHVLEMQSPYERHTYRYSPLVAYLTLPNILVHHTFGKILFCLFDIIDAILIRAIVKTTLFEYSQSRTVPTGRRRKSKGKKDKNSISKNDVIENISMLVWLYNPLTVAVATRGNCDAIAVFLVLATLYTLQYHKKYFLAGLIHGVSIHFRLYPIIYSLTFYMHLSQFSFYSLEDRRKDRSTIRELTATDTKTVVPKKPERKTIFKKRYLLYLYPNFDQFRLVQGCVLSLSALTALFYSLYGPQFLHETYFYHFTRKDTRHNFSLYFYLQYLTAWVRNVGVWQKVLMVLPQAVLLLVLSFRYGLNRFSLNFSVLTQTIVMVAYNTVLTSQYFVWIMAVLPLCLWQIRMGTKTAVFLVGVWFAAQGAWLLPAYFLEFHGQNTFLFVWIQSVSFFCANIAILGRMIMYFMPGKKDV